MQKNEVVREISSILLTIICLLSAPWACKSSLVNTKPAQEVNHVSSSSDGGQSSDGSVDNSIILICGEDDIFISSEINPPLDQVECPPWFGKPRRKVIESYNELSPAGYVVRCLCP